MTTERPRNLTSNYRTDLTTELARITYLKFLCAKGWKKYLSKLTPQEIPIYKERLNFELETLILKQFVSYFLIVADYVNYAKDSGINVGPGRGSGAGSLIAYLLNITEVDPIKGKLLFERFLNPELSIYDFELAGYPKPDNLDEVKSMKFHLLPRWESLNTSQKDAAILEYRYLVRQGDLAYFKYLLQSKIKTQDNEANSFLLYLLGITDIIPPDHRISRLRIKKPGSFAVPDFDVDFADVRRKEVFSYIFSKYGGFEYVATIGTNTTLLAKGVIRDVARALEVPISETNEIIKAMETVGVTTSSNALETPLKDLINTSTELKPWVEKYPKLFETALKLEGLPRNSSKHAAGIIISPDPIVNHVPLRRVKDEDSQGETLEYPSSQLTMSEIDKMGLLKVDVLGIKTLSVIGDCVKLIEKKTKTKIELRDLPEEPPRTWKLLASECLAEIFQVDGSPAMHKFCQMLAPSCKSDLAALVALDRPGPISIGLHLKYINRKHKREATVFLHPDLKEILGDTYGVMIYQEQLIQIAQKLANYTAVEADFLRKAISKSKPELIEQQKARFIEGCNNNNIPRNISESLYSDFEKFGQYAFNRAHSACYGEMAFRTAYLKAHHTIEFYCAALNHVKKKKDLTEFQQVNRFSKEMKRYFKIGLLPPHVNISSAGFSIDYSKNSIRFGFRSIKKVGEKARPYIEEIREFSGNFTSFEDFVKKSILYFKEEEQSRSAFTKTVYYALVLAGCFDDLKAMERDTFIPSRSFLKKYHEEIYTYVKKKIEQEYDIEQERILFESGEKKKLKKRKEIFPPDYTEAENIPDTMFVIQEYEKEVLEMPVSSKVLEPFEQVIRERRLGTITEASNGRCHTIAAEITSVNLKQDKKGNMMAFVGIQDQDIITSATMFSSVYTKCQSAGYTLIPGMAVELNVEADSSKRLLIRNLKPLILEPVT